MRGNFAKFYIAFSFILLTALASGYWFFLRPALAVDLQDGLVGHWTFDGQDMIENVADVSGQGNHGEGINIAATTTPLGRINQALELDGTDDYLDMGTNDADFTVTDTFSVFSWINYTDGSESPPFIIGYEQNNNERWSIALDNEAGGSASLNVTVKNGGTNYGDQSADGTVVEGEWAHVGFTFVDGATVSIYINGDAVTTQAETNISTTNSLRIGGKATNTNFDGLIDDVRVYHRALSATEVRALFREREVNRSFAANPTRAAGGLEDGLVAHYTFDGQDMIENVADASGNGHSGRLVNFSATSTKVGKLGQAMRFNESASNERVQIDDELPGFSPGTNDSVSVSAWMKVDSFLAFGRIFERGSDSGKGLTGFSLTTDSDAAESIGFFWQNTSGTGDKGFVNSTTISVNDGEWHHVVGMMDGGTMRAFVDGVEQSGSQTGSYTDGGATAIGGRGSDDRPFKGLIDDVRVYDRALSVDEVRELYALGTEKRATIAAAPTRAAGGLEDGLVGHWTFDGRDIDWGATDGPVKDVSGNANHGDVAGGISTTTAPKVGKLGQALEFDGVDDYVEAEPSTSVDITGSVTVATWVRSSRELDPNNDQYLNIVAKNSLFVAGYGLDVYERFTNSELRLEFWTRGVSYNVATELVTSSWLADTWYHIVGTYDGVNNKLYRDGILVDTATGIDPGDTSTEALRIGNGNNGAGTDKFWPGLIDDVRIYNRALSADEVRELYEYGTTRGLRPR